MTDKRNDDGVVLDGWKSIETACLMLYPGQTDPKHYGTLISWQLGGDDPLDGISIYDGGEYYHFVTFGLSELNEKVSEDLEYSGYGFEFTLKLKKSCLKDEELAIRGICGILQAIAKISFTKGTVFYPNEYLYTGQTTGIDPDGKSLITGFITQQDEMGKIQTGNGSVEFVELIGATDTEIKAIMNKETNVQELFERIGSDVTDYDRKSAI